jgi:hypothetical protein
MALPRHVVLNTQQDLGRTKEAKLLDEFTANDDLEDDELEIESAIEAANAAERLSRRANAKSRATLILNVAMREGIK